MEDKIEIRMCGKWVPATRDVALRLAKFLFVKMVAVINKSAIREGDSNGQAREIRKSI